MTKKVQVEDQRPVGVARSLAALRELSRHPRGIGLDEFARVLGLPKSSAHRSLAALRRGGLVEQDEQRRYRLSLEYVRLAFTYYEALDIQSIVLPTLEALAELVRETTHYAVLDVAEVVYVARVSSPGSSFQLAATVGGRQPAHRTGLGKALLAYELPDAAAVERFAAEHGPLMRADDVQPIASDAFAAELASVRQRGYALDNQENERGINCLAFPVFLGSRIRPTGAISVSAVAHRTPLVQLAEHAEELRTAIESRLGPVTRAHAAAPAEIAAASAPVPTASCGGSVILVDEAAEPVATANLND